MKNDKEQQRTAEERMMNGVGIDHKCDSEAFGLVFSSFFLFIAK